MCHRFVVYTFLRMLIETKLRPSTSCRRINLATLGRALAAVQKLASSLRTKVEKGCGQLPFATADFEPERSSPEDSRPRIEPTKYALLSAEHKKPYPRCGLPSVKPRREGGKATKFAKESQPPPRSAGRYEASVISTPYCNTYRKAIKRL